MFRADLKSVLHPTGVWSAILTCHKWLKDTKASNDKYSQTPKCISAIFDHLETDWEKSNCRIVYCVSVCIELVPGVNSKICLIAGMTNGIFTRIILNNYLVKIKFHSSTRHEVSPKCLFLCIFGIRPHVNYPSPPGTLLIQKEYYEQIWILKIYR